jgi:hypothetical protein
MHSYTQELDMVHSSQILSQYALSPPMGDTIAQLGGGQPSSVCVCYPSDLTPPHLHLDSSNAALTISVASQKLDPSTSSLTMTVRRERFM